MEIEFLKASPAKNWILVYRPFKNHITHALLQACMLCDRTELSAVVA